MEIVIGVPYQPKNVLPPKERSNLSSKAGMAIAPVVLTGALLTTQNINAFAAENDAIVQSVKVEALTQVAKNPIVAQIAPDIQKQVVKSEPAVALNIVEQAQKDVHSVSPTVASIAKVTVAEAVKNKTLVVNLPTQVASKPNSTIITAPKDNGTTQNSKDVAQQTKANSPTPSNPSDTKPQNNGDDLLAKLQITPEILKNPVTTDDFVKLAKLASAKTGWKVLTILSQWQTETTYEGKPYNSPVLKENNNIAGMTWYPGCGFERGSKRPDNEGGYYIKYPDIVTGYVSFIKNNNRYDHVKEKTSPEEQAKEIAHQGWALDRNAYANALTNKIQVNRSKLGDIPTPVPETKTDNSSASNAPTDKSAQVTDTDKKSGDTTSVQGSSNKNADSKDNQSSAQNSTGSSSDSKDNESSVQSNTDNKTSNTDNKATDNSKTTDNVSSDSKTSTNASQNSKDNQSVAKENTDSAKAYSDSDAVNQDSQKTSVEKTEQKTTSVASGSNVTPSTDNANKSVSSTTASTDSSSSDSVPNKGKRLIMNEVLKAANRLGKIADSSNDIQPKDKGATLPQNNGGSNIITNQLSGMNNLLK